MKTVKSCINGIDTDALKQMMQDVDRDPSAGIAKFQVATSWKGDTRTETRVDSWEFAGRSMPRNFTIITDEPPELLGGSTAPNPQEVLMAGLNTCVMVGYVTCAAVKGVELKSLTIEAEGELDLRGFLALDDTVKPGYEEIRLNVRVKGDGTPQQFQEILDTVTATSPNYWNLANPVRIKPTLMVE